MPDKRLYKCTVGVRLTAVKEVLVEAHNGPEARRLAAAGVNIYSASIGWKALEVDEIRFIHLTVEEEPHA